MSSRGDEPQPPYDGERRSPGPDPAFDKFGNDPHTGPSAGEVAAKTAKATGRGVAAMAKGTARFSRYTFRQARRASHAEGAGDSGLAPVIELHAVNSAADVAVAISLAGTLFFQVPDGDSARWQVAQFLALTMLPFAIVAPLIGPFLDRFAYGRRWSIGSTMAIRAFLCWVLAGAVITESTWLFPAALGVLVASKAYIIAKTAAVPRLVPDGFTLVKSNGRVSLAGVVGAAVGAPLAGLASLAGSEWSLRFAFVLFIIGTVLSILLPARVDSTHGETRLALVAGRSAQSAGRDPGNRRTATLRLPPSVAFAQLANFGPRWLSGFLTMFGTFLLTTQPFDGWSTPVLFALIIGAAGVGNTLGIALASLLRKVNPAVTVVVALVAAALAAGTAAIFYGVLTLSLLGLTAGLAQSLAKLSLDSTIQHDVHERVQTSALGRSDTLLQFAWVVGGFVGIAVPPEKGHLGMWVAAVALTAWTAFVLGGRARAAARRREATPKPGPKPGPKPRQQPGHTPGHKQAGRGDAPAARREAPGPSAQDGHTKPYATEDDDVVATRPYDAGAGEAGRTTIVMPPERD